jgi:hypothetical protein
LQEYNRTHFSITDFFRSPGNGASFYAGKLSRELKACPADIGSLLSNGR